MMQLYVSAHHIEILQGVLFASIHAKPFNVHLLNMGLCVQYSHLENAELRSMDKQMTEKLFQDYKSLCWSTGEML